MSNTIGQEASAGTLTPTSRANTKYLMMVCKRSLGSLGRLGSWGLGMLGSEGSLGRWASLGKRTAKESSQRGALCAPCALCGGPDLVRQQKARSLLRHPAHPP